MNNEYREALERIADGEPGPRAIAEETLEDNDGPASGVVQSCEARFTKSIPKREGRYVARYIYPDKDFNGPEFVTKAKRINGDLVVFRGGSDVDTSKPVQEVEGDFEWLGPLKYVPIEDE